MKEYLLKKAAYYYYTMLSEPEKKLYVQIMNAFLNFKGSVDINIKVTEKTVEKLFRYVCLDRPDIFWIAREYAIVSRESDIVELKFNYKHSYSEACRLVEKIRSSMFYRELDSILEKSNSHFDKALAAYEYIIKNTDYEQAALRDSDRYYYAFGLDGVVLYNRAVCAGYSKAFAYFLSRHGCVCSVVTGMTKREAHAWNLINLYGEYYYIDTTWGDPVFSGAGKSEPDYISYDYFCFNTDDLKKTHSPVLDDKMPLCTAVKYNYYRYFGLIEDTYSIESVASHIVMAKREKKSEAMIKYSTAQQYRIAKIDLFVHKQIFKALRIASQYEKGINSTNVSYSANDEGYTIRIDL